MGCKVSEINYSAEVKIFFWKKIICEWEIRAAWLGLKKILNELFFRNDNTCNSICIGDMIRHGMVQERSALLKRLVIIFFLIIFFSLPFSPLHLFFSLRLVKRRQMSILLNFQETYKLLGDFLKNIFRFYG